jgi:hypothetical protein
LRFHVDYRGITKHFESVNPYQKDDVQQKQFMEDLLFFVAKGYMPIFGVENQWLKRLVMHQNSQVVFFNQKQMVQHAILSLMAKTTNQYVMLTLDSCVITPIF